ncbi:MAG TPA: MFS transporter [Opitutaceae bacterium]
MADEEASPAADRGDPEELSLRPFRPGLMFGFFNAMTWQVALGTPMVLFAERLGASAFAVGLAYSFVFVLTPVQVLATALLPKYGYKRMMLSGWGLRSLFLLPPVALAWMAPATGATWMVVAFIGSVFFFTFFRSIGSCAYLPWLNALLPGRIRGKYFASEQTTAGVGGVGTLLLSALSFKVLPLYVAFFLQYLFAFLGSWLSAVALSRLRDAEKPSALSLGDVLRATPRMIFAPSTFRRFLFIGIWAGTAVSAIPPFCAYYLRVGPQLSAAQIVLFTTVQYAGVISGAFSLRNRVDHFGARPFFIISLAAYAGIGIFWVFLLRGAFAGLGPIYVMYFLLGVAASSWFSASMKFLPQVVEPGQKALAYSIHGAVTSLVSGLAPVGWGLFIKGHSEASSIDPVAFQAFFITAIVSALGISLLVARLPEEIEKTPGWFPGGFSLRPFRAFTFFASLVVPAEERPRLGGSPAPGDGAAKH